MPGRFAFAALFSTVQPVNVPCLIGRQANTIGGYQRIDHFAHQAAFGLGVIEAATDDAVRSRRLAPWPLAGELAVLILMLVVVAAIAIARYKATLDRRLLVN